MYAFLMVIVLGFQEPDSMTSYVYSSDEEIQCNSGTCNEKRRRVHNEVERRRKDKINNWIIRIGDLLPDKNRKKQCINEILEQAVVYIRYLQDANDKLLQDKCTEVQVEELRRMTKKMKELEEENTQCLRLLQKAGISSITCPEEFCDHKSGRYSNKLTPEQASALLTQFENDSLANGVTKLRSVMQNKCGMIERKSISYNMKCDFNSKKCNELTESLSEKLATEIKMPSEKVASSVSTPQSLTSSCAENQITTITQHCPSPSVSTNSSKCQYAISCSSEETNLSLDVCDITAVTQALPPVPVMSTSQNSNVHQNSVHKTAKQSVTPLNQLIQPQILSPCAPAPATNRGSTIQNISSPLLVINEHGIPVLHNIVAFQNIQPSVFSNCSSAPAILTSSNNGFGQTQSPLAISQIGPYGNYKPIYVTKDATNSTKVTSVPTTFSVSGSPNSSIAGVPILASNSCFTSTVRPQSTLTGEAKSILSPLITQVPLSGSSQGGALKLSTGLQSSSLGQGTLSQIISHPMDDLTASNMHIQQCSNHSISHNLPSNTLPPTMVTPGGILVGQPLSIGQHGQVLTMGNGQILAAQSNVSTQQPFPSALILPNGQVIPVVSQPSVVYANPTVNNNIVLAQTAGKQNLQAASPVVTSIKNQTSPLLANSINNTILFSPSGSTGNNFKFSSVALTLSQASNSQSSTSFTSDITSTMTQKSKTIESLQTSQNDHVITTAEEELLKCNGTTQSFQGPLPAVMCSKGNCHNSEANSRQASTSSTKNASITKNKSNSAGSKRAGRILKPKPSSTSHHSGMLSGKIQHSGKEIGMTIRKQISCSSSTNNISSSDNNTEKIANSANGNSSTNSLSSSSPISRTDDNINLDSTETSLVSSSSNTRMTTDILAKATESIFSSCVSDLSPSITSFSSGKNEVLRNTSECSLLNGEKNKRNDNDQKHNKQQRFYHMDSSNSSVTDSCVSTQPQDLLSTLTATVFGDSSVDSSGDELAFTQVESSPSKLMSTLSRSLMSKSLKNNSHVEVDIAKLKCRTTNNNNEVPPVKKVKTVEPTGNGTATSSEQYREKVQTNCFGLTTSTNSEDSHNRITSTTKCFLSEEKQFKQKVICATTNSLSSEVTQIPTSVSQLLLADSTSALCSKSSQRNSERQNSPNVNFVNSGESSAQDTELPALILGSLGDDSNTPSSVNASSNSGIPFLALSPSEHFPSDLPKDTPLNNDSSFNMLDNCRSSNIDSVETVKNKRSPSIHQKADINKTNSGSDFADLNNKSSDQSKQVLSSSRLPDQETDISSTLSPPLVMKSNCSQTVASQQGIVHEDNLNAIQKETQCPPTSNIMGSTSQTQSDVSCQAPILSPVSSLSFIAPSPPPLLSRNMINDNHVSISSHFPPLSSQNNLGISSSQTQLPSTASSHSSNSTHISSFKQSTDRSSTPKKSVTFPTNPPSIITSTAITSTSTSTNFASHTTVAHTLSNYSAEALIGQQPTMTSTSLINPIVSQSYYSSTSSSDCPRTSRPPISYSAESLIQTQSCIDKKQDMVVSKETMPNNVSPNMNSYRHQTQHLQQHGGQQGVLSQTTNVSQSLVTNVADRRLSCSNLIPSSDMMPQNSFQSNFHLQGTPSYANLTHSISTGAQQNLMNNHFSGGPPPILMRHGAPTCQQLDQCLPCNQPSHNSSSLPQGYSLALSGNKNCHTVNTFHQNRPPVDASISQTLPSCLSNSGNLSNIPITNSQQQNGCLFPNHTPSGSLLQVPDTNFSILQNSSSSFNNQVRNESRPPVFNNFPQHAQNPLVNNLFHGPFVTNVNTQRNDVSNAMSSQQPNRPSEGVKHVTREQRSSSQSQSPPNQTKISPKSKSNAKKSKQNTGTEDVTMPSTPYENINVRMPTHFSVPELSFPRNDTPCLGNTYFGGSQRPLVPTISNIQTQNKSIPTVASSDSNINTNPTYNPIFRRQSENSLNFNFQPSTFSVNSLHRPVTTGSENIPSAQITCHTTTASAHPIPNFNLSNIFPDISTSNESINLPGMKFHHNNHIISPSTSNQIQASEGSMTHPNSHQNRAPPPLYHGRTHPPVIHNGVGFNGILGPNTHGFEGHGTQVAVGINNTMGHHPPPPPPFAPSHSHTPSFGNVLPPLNFPMHDH